MRYLREWPLLAAAALLVTACSRPALPPDPSPECGRTRLYASCRPELQEDACLAAGGEWGQWGLVPESSCRCPTSDAGCPCTSSAQCEGECIAPLGLAGGGCEALAEGNCSAVRPVFGCFCIFEEGRADAICID